MQQQTFHKTEKESPAYLDPQIATRTNLYINREEVTYFAKAMRHYRDKEMLVIPFNTANSINFYQV
jgi:hypothetical protein